MSRPSEDERRAAIADLVASTVLDEGRAVAGVDLCEMYGLGPEDARKVIRFCLDSGLSLINVLSVTETFRTDPIRFYGIPHD